MIPGDFPMISWDFPRISWDFSRIFIWDSMVISSAGGDFLSDVLVHNDVWNPIISINIQ